MSASAGRWTRVRTVVPAVVLLAGALVVVASRTWVAGTPRAEVVGTRALEATGGEAAPGVVALALAAAAGAVAAATSGRLGRRVSLLLLTLAALGVAVTVGRVVPTHGQTLGELAAKAAGHTGTVAVDAHLTAWAWVATVLAVLLLVATGLAWAGHRGWRGLSDRYARTDDAVAGDRGERVGSDWDRLSRGDDPTA